MKYNIAMGLCCLVNAWFMISSLRKVDLQWDYVAALICTFATGWLFALFWSTHFTEQTIRDVLFEKAIRFRQIVLQEAALLVKELADKALAKGRGVEAGEDAGFHAIEAIALSQAAVRILDRAQVPITPPPEIQ